MNAWPLYYAFYVSAVYFAVGAISVVRINKLKGDAAQRWLKFSIYISITFLLISLIIYYQGFYGLLMTGLCLAGGYEIIRNGLKKKTYRALAAGLILYTLIAVAFLRLNFIFSSAGLVYIYILVSLFDSFGQVTGQWIGRHKMGGVSPNKTWEGVAGGAIVALFTAFFLIPEWLNPFNAWLPFFVIAGALLGDLAASWFKRLCKIKDYSSLIPGHGGILDRFDSLIGAGAAVYLANLILS